MNVSKDVADAIEALFTTNAFESVEAEEPGKVKVVLNREFAMNMIRLRLVAGLEVNAALADECYRYLALTGRLDLAQKAGLVNGVFEVPEDRVDPPLPAWFADIKGPDPDGFKPGETLMAVGYEREHDWQPRTSSLIGVRCSLCLQIATEPHQKTPCLGRTIYPTSGASDWGQIRSATLLDSPEPGCGNIVEHRGLPIHEHIADRKETVRDVPPMPGKGPSRSEYLEQKIDKIGPSAPTIEEYDRRTTEEIDAVVMDEVYNGEDD